MRVLPYYTAAILLMGYWFLTAGAWHGVRPLLAEKSAVFRRRSAILLYLEAVVLSLALVVLVLFRSAISDHFFNQLKIIVQGLLFMEIVVKMPALIAWLLFPVIRNPRGKSVISRMALLLSSAAALIFLWAFTAGRLIPVIRNIDLSFESLPPAFDGFRISHISDIHWGGINQEFTLRMMALHSARFSPDAVVFTGDLFNDVAVDTEKAAASLGRFKAVCGEFAVSGNHDYGDYTPWRSGEAKQKNLAGIRETLRAARFRLLENESYTIRRGNDSILITGVGNRGDFPLPRYDNLEKATAGISDSPFSILLSHNPALWDEVLSGEHFFPLTLSGHTHGFQWGITMAGIRFSLAGALRPHWAGIYREGESLLYINPGAGVVGVPFRIDMPPELTLITLRCR